ncbi:MAG: response regulator [Acidobacteria bacterium]|nr:response regulator [Acidobacteriota bacterium]
MSTHLLVVDDSPAMRKMITRVIEMSGFELASLAHASDGAQALEILHQNQVDLVLTDINMPVMTGEELLREMAGNGMLKRIPVVVVSTDATDARMHQMMELGARGYVVKPFQPASLRSELERVMEIAQ